MGDASRCLDCGAELRGRFCSACGQRVAPAFPTLRMMLVEAWHELTVFDERLARTAWLLLKQPGTLINEYLAGRRTRYVPPLRTYLVASVTYFLLAAMIPSIAAPRRTARLPGKGDVNIDLMRPQELTPEQRAAAERSIERAPWILKPMMRRAFFDTRTVRDRMLETIPRAFFVLVPVFAGIVAVFYRRPFSQHLVFALYLHAAIFTALAVRRLANLTRSTAIVAVVEFVTLLFIVWYSQFSFRRVYGDSWWRVVLKSVAITVVYLIAGMIALAAAFAWSTLT